VKASLSGLKIPGLRVWGLRLGREARRCRGLESLAAASVVLLLGVAEPPAAAAASAPSSHAEGGAPVSDLGFRSLGLRI
jgi:hypothetical protein